MPRKFYSQSMWFLKYLWIYAYLPGQCFEKLFSNAASCQTADSTWSVSTAIAIEPELKNIKTT